MAAWYEVSNAGEIPSPALLVYPDRIAANIAEMIRLVDDRVDRIRPHVKTHKMREVVQLQLDAGIRKFKAATIAEAEMTAAAGAPDVLLAYQPVGPNIERLTKLRTQYAETRFAALVDDAGVARTLSQRFASDALDVYVDIDCGMGRTGIRPEAALELIQLVESLPGLQLAGLHAYDGHLHQTPLKEREEAFADAFAEVDKLIVEAGIKTVVGGGSPTYPIHAHERGWECSPGTTLFWDSGYGEHFPDLHFETAALLMTRLISKPGKNRLCLDLGHKAVGAENPLDHRVRFLNLENATFVSQSEEHLVVETEDADHWEIGDVLYGEPWHICPSVALYQEAIVIRNGKATGERWKVEARNRMITI